MKKSGIAIIVVIAISVLIGMATNYIGGIITFGVLGLIVAIVSMQYKAHGAKPIARKLLEQEKPNMADVDQCIKDLGGSGLGDEESKELIRRLMAKRDSLVAK